MSFFKLKVQRLNTNCAWFHGNKTHEHMETHKCKWDVNFLLKMINSSSTSNFVKSNILTNNCVALENDEILSIEFSVSIEHCLA